MCLECHGPKSPNGPHEPALSPHAPSRRQHGERLPRLSHAQIEQTLSEDFVRAHTFRFITPAETEQYKIPNPCTSCHTDKTTAGAK